MNMKRGLIYGVLGMALLVGSSLFVSSEWLAERDVLSFVSTTSEDRPIIFMDTNGEVLEELIAEPGHPFAFSWSPDRRSIAYEVCRNANCEIHMMEVKTNVIRAVHRRLTFGGDNQSPAWSPNKRWIAFVSERAGDKNIYRMDVDGENVIQLTKQERCDEPDWSPDSRWIAFVSNATLFVMGADGRNLRQLGNAGAVLFDCAWSPNGKQIAFIGADAEGSIEIFSIDVDGGNLRQLTQLQEQIFIWELVWSPSGKSIAYIVTGGLPKGPINQIFANSVIGVVDAAGGGHSEQIEATKGLGARYLSWLPEAFFSVSPSAEKRTTFWGRIKQTDK